MYSGYAGHLRAPGRARISRFRLAEWTKAFGGSADPKKGWKYIVGAGCQHNLISPDVVDAKIPIEKMQIWMSNFSLQPLALECRTLTQCKIDQGANWSLVGSSHKHRHARGSGKLEDGGTIKMARYSGTYTSELSELYAICV